MKADLAARVFAKIDMSGGAAACWPPHSTDSLWKGRPYIYANSKKYHLYRVVYELVNGPIPEGMLVRHKCDNPLCCNPAHHELGTHIDNMRDMKERHRHGMSHYVVKAIRKLTLEQGKSDAEVAELYGISSSTVRRIRTGQTHADTEPVREGE